MSAISNEERILEIPVTQSYTVTVRITDWVKNEARRRSESENRRVSGSEIVREVLDKAITETRELVAA